MMSMIDTAETERRIDTAEMERRLAERIDTSAAAGLSVSSNAGGIAFSNASQAMEFAKMMSIGGVAVPPHLRANPGACLAVVVQAIEWRLSPYAVANKSYEVNKRMAYESQLIQAVILQRAPIKGRFKVEYSGEGTNRKCKVTATLRDGEIVDYESPPIRQITPQNSPLWKSDPDQQLFYYSGRALCRRHFPDVLLGVYAEDEIEPAPRGPDTAKDVTPKSLNDKLAALGAAPESQPHQPAEVKVVETAPDQPAVAEPAVKDAPSASDTPAKAEEWARKHIEDGRDPSDMPHCYEGNPHLERAYQGVFAAV